jgi:hypothetical protein
VNEHERAYAYNRLQLFEPDARAVYTLDAVASLTRIKLIMDLVREVERLREELNFRQRRL